MGGTDWKRVVMSEKRVVVSEKGGVLTKNWCYQLKTGSID